MKYLRISLILLFTSQLNLAKAQMYEFHHSWGSSMAFSSSNDDFGLGNIGLSYFPRLALEMPEAISFTEYSFTVGVPITVDLPGLYGVVARIPNSFSYDIAAVGDFNIGHGAVLDSYEDFGGFIGIGMGRYFNSRGGDFGTDIDFAGLYWHVGMRFGSSAIFGSTSFAFFSYRSEFQNVFGLRFLSGISDF